MVGNPLVFVLNLNLFKFSRILLIDQGKGFLKPSINFSVSQTKSSFLWICSLHLPLSEIVSFSLKRENSSSTVHEIWFLFATFSLNYIAVKKLTFLLSFHIVQRSSTCSHDWNSSCDHRVLVDQHCLYCCGWRRENSNVRCSRYGE